ncbi:MAG: FimB/Mfa2 family fimbrial subunit [Muribaculaceae bacterium]|nr:FimB/Mfa2 family fimbrial subunit [Muribaculaceae bacterium]
MWRLLTAVVITAASVLALPSCESLYEDLDPCPQGLRVRFVYDYNMEFANAFTSQVDCLTVFLYDKDGHWLATRTDATPEQLADENWRMDFDLEAGHYTLLVYGGMKCKESSFSFTSDPAEIPLRDVRVRLNSNCLTSPVGTQLHPLFYGRLDAEVREGGTDYNEVTVKMIKDTNNLRVLLQQASGAQISESDFDFRVVDNNTLMGWNNDVLPSPEVSYMPWTRGNSSPGQLPNHDEASVAWAEMSFPRLVTGLEPHLIVTNRENGDTTIDIPLNNYLLLLKSQEYSKMGAQEFLDRESRWSMLFFLDSDLRWIKTTIVINDWVVRINDSEL